MTTIKQEINLNRRMFKDSGYLYLNNLTAILPSADYFFTLDERFIPYDDILAVNLNSDNDCEITINYNFKFPLPKGTQTNPSVPARTIKITNKGLTQISVEEIEIYYRNTGHKGQEALSKLNTAANVGSFASSIIGMFR
jgi:hypothetical protein